MEEIQEWFSAFPTPMKVILGALIVFLAFAIAKKLAKVIILVAIVIILMFVVSAVVLQ